MVAVKGKLLHSINSLIVLMISLLGFTTSCKDEPAEYGTPNATFVITGKVESVTDNKPIMDIIVEMRRVATQDNSSQGYLVGTGFSNGSGSYYVDATESPKEQTFKLKFIDTDGPLNGEYQTLDTAVVFQDPQFTNGDGSWYKGYTEKTLDVKLKPVNK